MHSTDALSSLLHCPKRRWICLVGFLAFTGFSLVRFGPQRLIFPDAMEYADTARAWARGEGLLDRAVWVYQLNFREGVPSPMVRRAVLFPLIEGVVFWIFGATDAVAIATSIAFFILSLLFMSGVAERLLPETRFKGVLILVGVMWCLLDVQQLQLASSGLSEPLFACLVLGTAWLLTRPPSHAGALLLGFLVGLSQWVRLNGFVLLLPVMLALLPHFDRMPWRRVLLVPAGALAPLLALAWRNHSVVGHFSFVGINSAIMFNGIGGIGEHGIEHRLFLPPASPPTLAFVLEHHLDAFALKICRGANLNMAAMLGAFGPVMFGGALVGTLAAWPRLSPGHRSLAVFACAALLLSIALFSVGEFEGPRFYVPFSPLVVLLACSVFGHIRAALPQDPEARAHGWIMGSVFAVLFLALTLPGAYAWFRSIPRGKVNPGLSIRADLSYMRASTEPADPAHPSNTPQGAVVMTDIPWAVSWYGDRPAVWMPVFVSSVPLVAERSGAEFLYLTSLEVAGAELDPNWHGIYADGSGRPPHWRPVAKGFGTLYQISNTAP